MKTNNFEDFVLKFGEKAFLEEAYQSRKFLIDKDVFSFPIQEEYKKFFYGNNSYPTYDWKYAITQMRIFNKLAINPIRIFNVLSNYLPDLINADIKNWSNLNTLKNINFTNEEMIDNIKTITFLFQNRFIYELIKDSETDERCKKYFLEHSCEIPKNEEIFTLLHQFFFISCKYGVYFADLIFSTNIDSVLEFYFSHRNISNNDKFISSSRPSHIRYIDFYNDDKNIKKGCFIVNQHYQNDTYNTYMAYTIKIQKIHLRIWHPILLMELIEQTHFNLGSSDYGFGIILKIQK